MNWSFIDSGEGTGAFNMRYDLALTKTIKPNEAILRFYKWRPYCISLGFNQNEDQIDIIKARANNIDIVSRPTGGRAVLHANELTYSVVYPLDVESSPRMIYKLINQAISKGLELYDKRLAEVELQQLEPDLREEYKKQISAACFAVSAKNELKYQGKKIVGSAQRKFNHCILQHGSILCGTEHKQITQYLANCNNEKSDVQSELNEKTVEIETVLSERVDFERLKTSLLKGFEAFFDCQFEQYQFKV